MHVIIFCLLLLIFLSGVHQVIIPILYDKPIFPAFRKSKSDKRLQDAKRRLLDADTNLKATRVETEAAERDAAAWGVADSAFSSPNDPKKTVGDK